MIGRFMNWLLCTHNWQQFDYLYRYRAVDNQVVGVTYVQKCSKCGAIKKSTAP